MKVEIYTDGACSGNPGKGGWGAVILFNDEVIELAEDVKHTTNQEMELVAACNALCYLKLQSAFRIVDVDIVIYTDSAYLHNCWKDEWWKRWTYNGWLNTKKEPVANKKSWELLIPWFKMSNFSIIKVKGHASNYWNNVADQLATGKIKPKEVKYDWTI
jgi:ribonuclease HI